MTRTLTPDEVRRAAEQAAVDMPPSTWRPKDLTSVLNGTWQPPRPTVGERDDGRGLFYPGRLHVVAAETEAGKTWFALAAAAAELERGNACLYLDFEDDEGGVVGRLMAMQVDHQAIRDRFAYIRPEDSVNSFANRGDLAQALDDLKPTLAILDGVTEAMALHGLELKDNSDVAAFGRMLPRWIADHGAATTALDHVVKDRENRGGYAIGGVHKLNGLNGAMYLLENKSPFGIGMEGRSRLLIRKDRPGQLRRHGVPAGDGLFLYADLVVKSHAEEWAEVSLDVPEVRADKPFRPTVLMSKISALLATVPGGLSKNAIEGGVRGNANAKRLALELLVREGYVQVEKQGAAQIHKLLKPFDDS